MALITNRTRPQRLPRRVGADLQRAVPRGRTDRAVDRAPRGVGACADHPVLPRLPPLLEAPAHPGGCVQRVLRADAPAGAARADRLREAGGGGALRVRAVERYDVEADARRRVVHGVREMPGREPCLAEPQAADADAGPDVLFWVGCAPAFDERARKAAVSTATLMQKAGVDFAVLGPREACTGDPARRMGDEYTFQRLAGENVATLNGAQVKKIVTTCPHCFNTLGNEYGDFGGSYEVVHHTEFLAELVREGKLSPVASDRKITYHDSCYLARHNDVRAQPRELVDAVGKAVEMPRNRERTFCCGAGGARMWMEEKRGRPINQERVREAVATGAETLAVACPFCTVMLDDGVREAGAKLQVFDLATLLAEAVERKRT